METQTVTYRVEFVVEDIDTLGYINYVFRRLDHDSYDDEFLMCVRFPNWDQKNFELNDIGFVTVKYVREGVDKWYDGKEMITFKHTNIIFLKFIPLVKPVELTEIILD